MRALLVEAKAADLEDARKALQLIEQRGYQRGKQLLEELARLRDS